MRGSVCPHCGGLAVLDKEINERAEAGIACKKYPNLFGRVCLDCCKFSPPERKPYFVRKNEEKLKLCQQQVRDHLRAQAQRRRQMAIDQAHVNLDFKYVSDEITDLEFFVRYHQVAGHPTISLSEDGETWSDLPASLFSEVMDFIRQNSHPAQHVTPSKPSFQVPQWHQHTTPNSVNHRVAHPPPQNDLPTQRNHSLPKPSTRLPLPQIDGESLTPNSFREPADMEPLQSLAGISSLVSHGPVNHLGDEAVANVATDRPVIRSNREPQTDEEAIEQAKAAESQRSAMGGGPTVKRKND